MKIVCIGDSITYGYGVFRAQCWAELVQNKLNISIINKGINGDTTAGMLSRSYIDVIKNAPTHVIIMGGCNDLIANRSLNMIQDNITELVKESIDYNIIPIIGIEMPIDKTLAERKWSESPDYDRINSLIEDYRKWILKFSSENNIPCIDFYSCLKENLKNKNPKELYIDGLHPTVLGHKLMAECAVDVFNSIT
jgi:Lysophospholipase L1 and related esterases